MLNEIPIPMSADNKDEPPYDKNKSGIPVIGIIPIVIPTLIKKWNTNIPDNPATMYAPKGSEVVLIIFIKRRNIIKNKEKSNNPPINPISSENIEKIKSVLC